MLKCPRCGSALQTLDLPCPHCAVPVSTREATEFSKTFTNRTTYRYRPEELLQRVNAWLRAQTDIISVGMIMSRDRVGLITSITLSCRIGWGPSRSRFQFARLVLMSGFAGHRRVDLGDALNEWADLNPGCRRMNHWVLSTHGRPVETWLLYTEEASPMSDPAPQRADL
jgi:hypothetical protein